MTVLIPERYELNDPNGDSCGLTARMEPSPHGVWIKWFDHLSILAKATGQSFCARCGQPMRHNVPRLGPDGGHVHADSGLLTCKDERSEKGGSVPVWTAPNTST